MIIKTISNAYTFLYKELSAYINWTETKAHKSYHHAYSDKSQTTTDVPQYQYSNYKKWSLQYQY